jgi:cardiolipin synthase
MRTRLPAKRAPGAPRRQDEVRRLLAEQAFSRAAGAPLVPGNRIDLLLDATENYPAWMEAIASAERFVHLEIYIFRDDPTGREFARLLAERAKRGVRVRVLYDWFGGLRRTSRALVAMLRAAGVEVRSFNPPQLAWPLGWMSRDHRKGIVVDGRVAFLSGLCIAEDWVGWEQRGIGPWRDTGVAIRGPAVADVARAFGEMWATAGAGLPDDERPAPDDLAVAGDQALRVVATTPETSRLFRVDLLWASIARERLWLTDAYFLGTPSYLDALRAAAMGGVDVRLLVPSASDVELVATLSRTQYRPLLTAGVRVFEWNGPMLHAKTAVVDGRFGRVGSSNLNLASWFGNWELDVCVEDDDFAARLEAVYERDLDDATEVVLHTKTHVDLAAEREPPARRSRRVPGSASRAAAAAIELGGTLGAAITQRALAPVEARSLRVLAVVLLVFAVAVTAWPRVVAVPLGLGAAWLGISLLVRARQIRRRE